MRTHRTRKEAWLREQFQERKSVTELEILHGVRRNPAMAGHASCYFRDLDLGDGFADTVK